MTSVKPGQSGGQPVIAVTRGRPTPAEIAAVVAVLRSLLLSARSAAAPDTGAGWPPTQAPSPSRWAESSRPGTQLPRPGPRSWRASALPR